MYVVIPILFQCYRVLDILYIDLITTCHQLFPKLVYFDFRCSLQKVHLSIEDYGLEVKFVHMTP